MKIRHIFPFFLAVLLFISCGSGTTDESTFIPTEPEILTHVYLGEEILLPEGYDFLTQVKPYYADGIFTVLCRHDSTEYALVSFDLEGNILEDTPVSVVPDGLEINGPIKDGMITADELIVHMGYFSSTPAVRTAYLIRISRTNGTVTHSDDLIRLFSSTEATTRYYKILGFIRGGDGRYAYLSESELIVLDEHFNHILTYPSTAFIDDYEVTPDGEITIWGSFAKGTGLYKLNPETSVPDVLVETGTDAALTKYLYAPDGTLLYADDTGLYAVTDSGDELLMDWKNSGLTADRITVCAAADRDTLLGYVSSFGNEAGSLQIFRKSDDIVVSEIETIDLADLGGLDEYLSAYVVDYNLMHRTERIVVTDFGDMENGETQLLTAIQTGTYRPDIIVGKPESAALRKIVEDGLYTDLLPYLADDRELNADMLFGAVKRIFDDGGKMWGLSAKLTVDSVTAPVSKVGGRTHWTLDELLDYAAALPEEEDLMYGLNRKNAAEYLLGPAGYSMFADTDTGTASFDSDLFVRYLEFIASLPENYEYYSDKYGGYRKDALHSGKISLANRMMHDIMDWLQLEMDFDTKDYVFLGYPTDHAASTYATCDSAFVITSFASDPDHMWEVIKEIFPLDPSSTYYMIPNGLPALKYIFDVFAEDKADMEYFIYYSNQRGMSGHSYDPANPTKPEDLDEPAIITYFDAAAADAMKDLLDNRCGVSVMDALPSDLAAIVTEEISAYLAGRYTAEACAEVIQSRAEIWLSEHE